MASANHHVNDYEEAADAEEGEGEEDGQYEVERITGKKLMRGKMYYMVKWLGFSADENTWEPAANLGGSRDMILEFEESEKIRKQNAASKSSSASRARAPPTRAQRDKRSGSPESRLSGEDDGKHEKAVSTKRTRAAASSRTARVPEESYTGMEGSKASARGGGGNAVRTATRASHIKVQGSSSKPQQSGQKPSTLADEIFPSGNGFSGHASGRLAVMKAGGSGAVAKSPMNGAGSSNNNGKSAQRAREELQKFSKAPVYENLAEAKSGKIDLKDLIVRGMFMSSDEEPFALLSGSRGKESIEFYVGAKSLSGSSEDLARQMVNTLAQSIQVILPSRHYNN